MEKKKMNEMNQPLTEQDLEEISGGAGPGVSYSRQTLMIIRRDSKGNPTHFQNYFDGVLLDEPYHYVCPHCGRLLHQGVFNRMYCDPCDESWWADFSLKRVSGFYPGWE